jgi:hypothetical protein
MAFAGRIPVEIDHSEAVYAKDVEVSGKRNQQIHKFSTGKRGRSQGQPEYEWKITFSCPEDESQFRQLAEGGLDSEDGSGFTITYTKGGEKYMLLDCGINSDSVSSDQDGKADQSLSGVATDRMRVS